MSTRINIFETDLDGHRARYLREIVRGARGLAEGSGSPRGRDGNHVRLCIPGSLRHTQVYAEHLSGLEDSFEFYLNLIEKMRQEGYIKKDYLNDGKKDSDIGVAIGRLGELIHFRKGHHRLAIAKQIGLERVAIAVQLVHPDWIVKEMRAIKCEESLAIENGLRSLATRYEI